MSERRSERRDAKTVLVRFMGKWVRIPSMSAHLNELLADRMGSPTAWPVNDDYASPYFRRVCCRANGGKATWESVGFVLAINTDAERPPGIADNVWQSCLSILEAYLSDNEQEWVDWEYLWIWYRKTFPEFVRLVPVKLKQSFLDGVARAWRKGEMDSFLCPPNYDPQEDDGVSAAH
jgi:hypothetical protein